MRIALITPADVGLLSGNRLTAERISKHWSRDGHSVTIQDAYDGQPYDVLVALHARRSAKAIQLFHERFPEHPLVVVCTGTDIYEDLPSGSTEVKTSLKLATRVVVLQNHALRILPAAIRKKAEVIFQCAYLSRISSKPLKKTFEVSVIGHLREIKDPFRTAIAARDLPAESRIRISHVGEALEERFAAEAQAEMAINPRYHWLGRLPHESAVQVLTRSRLLVITSKSEGGPNIVSEALVANAPILSTRIGGVTGILGDDYPGYFPYGDTKRLTKLLWEVESNPEFYRQLLAKVRSVKTLAIPNREMQAWRKLFASFEPKSAVSEPAVD